ncbi:MAG: diguanylate cyclase [Rhodospirillaceae bacterium]
MSELDSAPEDTPGRDLFAAYRERIMRLMAIAGVIFLTPFAVNDLLRGRIALGCAILAVVAILAVDVIAIQRKKRPPIPFGLLLIPMAASIALSLMQQGFYGALWTYPAVLFCYFVLPRRMANTGSLLLAVLASVMAYLYVDNGPEVTVRFVVTLALTIVIVNIILNIVGQLQQELTDQALTDPLTGAFNRRQMDQSLAEAIERNRRSGAPVSLLIIDIDHFKRVNDDFGHHIGDKVLKGMVALIKGRSRKLDRLFRLGGEEFVLLLPDTRANAAMKQAEALRKLMSESKLIEQRPVTISIGVAEYWAEQSQEAWMQAADDALYQAKHAGRNMVVLGSADSDSIPGLAEGGEKRYSRAR